ncbi:response regulator transcription factor [uncultured Ruminococcus sp.]|uniref:response regulator transcription factor n=1 Tax=uncultured Ruminococcus sp. TaxID=165186 RepID=UPI003448F551
MKTFSEKNSGSQEDETHTEVTSPKKDETISAGGTVSSSQLEATLGIKNSSAKITVEEVLVSSGESVSEGTELYKLTDEKDIRKKHISVPILMLTARSEIEDKVRGLDSGADYYLTKPFDSRELLATVNALLRRQGTQVNELVFGNTHLDLESAELACDNNSVSLSAREFEVMRLLMISGKITFQRNPC